MTLGDLRDLVAERIASAAFGEDLPLDREIDIGLAYGKAWVFVDGYDDDEDDDDHERPRPAARPRR